MKKHRGHIGAEVDYTNKHPGPFHGSPMESHASGGGGYATTPLTIASHPGRAAMRIKPHREGGTFEGGKEKGPSKVRMSPRGVEEDQ